MAKFSQAFLQGLLQPSYQEGLFTAARQAAQLPAQLQQQQMQQQQMQKLRSMGAVERADYMAGIAQTPEQLMQAEAAKEGALKKSAMQSLRGLETARQAAETDEEKRRIENIMSRVAVQAEVDPSTITGRTQAEQDEALRREINVINLETKQREQQEAALQEAYFAVPESNREAFEQNLINSGFASVVEDVKEEKLRKETANLDYKNALQRKQDSEAQKKAALATSNLESSIDSSNIDEGLKINLKERLSRIKQPNFEAGETWNSGDKENAIREFNAINDLLSRAVVEQTNVKRQRLNRINALKDVAAKFVPRKSDIDAFDTIYRSREDATKMAREQALAPLIAQIKMLEKETESVNDLLTTDEEGTQTIGGFQVREIK